MLLQTHMHKYKTLIVLAVKCVYSVMSMFLPLNYPRITTSKNKNPFLGQGYYQRILREASCPFAYNQQERKIENMCATWSVTL